MEKQGTQKRKSSKRKWITRPVIGRRTDDEGRRGVGVTNVTPRRPL